MKLGKAVYDGVQDPTTMPFGKHKGEKLKDLPDKYLKWLVEQEFVKEKFIDLYREVGHELLGRDFTCQHESSVSDPNYWDFIDPYAPEPTFEIDEDNPFDPDHD